MKDTKNNLIKKTVILTDAEYKKALTLIKPGEKWTEFIKRKIFGGK